MNSFSQLYKTTVNRGSTTTKSVNPKKNVVDNRLQTVAQLKIQSAVSDRYKQVVQLYKDSPGLYDAKFKPKNKKNQDVNVGDILLANGQNRINNLNKDSLHLTSVLSVKNHSKNLVHALSNGGKIITVLSTHQNDSHPGYTDYLVKSDIINTKLNKKIAEFMNTFCVDDKKNIISVLSGSNYKSNDKQDYMSETGLFSKKSVELKIYMSEVLANQYSLVNKELKGKEVCSESTLNLPFTIIRTPSRKTDLYAIYNDLRDNEALTGDEYKKVLGSEHGAVAYQLCLSNRLNSSHLTIKKTSKGFEFTIN